MSKRTIVVFALCIIAAVVVASAYLGRQKTPCAETLIAEYVEASNKLTALTPKSELAKLPKLGTVEIDGKQYHVYLDKSWPRVFLRGRTDSATYDKVWSRSFEELSKFGPKAGMGEKDAYVGQRTEPSDSSGFFRWEMSYEPREPEGAEVRELISMRDRLRNDYLEECRKTKHPDLKYKGKGYAVTSDRTCQYFLTHADGQSGNEGLASAACAYVSELAAKRRTDVRQHEIIDNAGVG